MALSDVILLIAVTALDKDVNGVPVERETSRRVYCKVTSATASEFFGGGRNGLNPAYKFEVFAGDYQEEPIVVYKGQRYAVYRTYLVPGTDRLELHTERRGGTMARKTPVARLSSEIASILADYGDEVKADMDAAVKKVAKAGAKALRQESKRAFKGSGAYAKGWTSAVDTGKRTAQGVIYNKDMPYLPHLLEHGHLNRDGSRTPGRVHIALVEKQIVEDFTKEVEESL